MGSAKALHARRYRAFLALLRRAREEACLTQFQLARLVSRRQTWVSKCELGERRVDVIELEDWARACKKDVAWFFGSQD